MKFHENPSSGNRIVSWGQTDRQNAPKMTGKYLQSRRRQFWVGEKIYFAVNVNGGQTDRQNAPKMTGKYLQSRRRQFWVGEKIYFAVNVNGVGIWWTNYFWCWLM